jgi:hypothetical protein
LRLIEIEAGIGMDIGVEDDDRSGVLSSTTTLEIELDVGAAIGVREYFSIPEPSGMLNSCK